MSRRKERRLLRPKEYRGDQVRTDRSLCLIQSGGCVILMLLGEVTSPCPLSSVAVSVTDVFYYSLFGSGLRMDPL